MAAANPRLPGLPDNWRDLVDKHTDTIFVWDRHSMRVDAATGREVPDEKKRVVLYAYRNPRPAAWPKADFIVGNPPFIGVRRLKATIGDGYVETLRAAFPEVPETSDYVMYWWHLAAESVEKGKARRFGFITTNSITQAYSRWLSSVSRCMSARAWRSTPYRRSMVFTWVSPRFSRSRPLESLRLRGPRIEGSSFMVLGWY